MQQNLEKITSYIHIRNVLYSGNVWQKKFGKFGESSVICQTNLVFTIINNILGDLLFHQTLLPKARKE